MVVPAVGTVSQRVRGRGTADTLLLRWCAQDPNGQVAREAQNAFGALVDAVEAQQELRRRQGHGNGDDHRHPCAADLLVHTAEALLDLGRR